MENSVNTLGESKVMTFEDLQAWQRARELACGIYALTRAEGVVKDFGLSSQIQRAVVSIMANVAEGFERHHLQEKIQFYNIARGSAGEVRSLLYIIKDCYPKSADSAGQLQEDVVRVGKLVSGLIKSTQDRK